MSLTIDQLSPERQLILLCSRGVLRNEHIEKIKKILSNKLDWKDILYQGITHRVLNIMYYNLKKLNLTNKIEEEILKIMKNQSQVYAIRNKFYFKEIELISEHLDKEGIRAAILKGNYLASKVYPAIETRTFNDLDFLINVKDGDKIVSVLEKLGYIQGEYDDHLGKIIPSTKKQKLLHRVASYELQECMKITDNPFVPILQVDLNFDVLWRGNCPYNIDTEELLNRAIQFEIDGAKSYILDREDFLVQLACHLYKEATLLHWITDLRDLKIYKFADILMYIEKFKDEIDWDKLTNFTKKVQCEKVVYYAFYYVNLMYGPVVPDKVLRDLEPDDLGYLDEYGIENEKPSKWQFDFFTRIFETNRVVEINQENQGNTFRNAKYGTK